MEIILALHEDRELFKGDSALGIILVGWLLYVLLSGGKKGK